VKRIVFRNLPVDGGLVVEDDGFVIFARALDDQAPKLQAIIDCPSDGGCSLPSKARFTIAHEIAHTLLYDLSTRRPTSLLTGGSHRQFESLERTCNRGAARLLIPDYIIGKVLEPYDVVEASAFAPLSKQFRVSIQTLIQRFSIARIWGEKGGLAMYVEEADGGALKVCAHASDGRMRLLFPNVGFGVVLDEIFHDQSLFLYGGNSSRVEREISRGSNGRRTVQPCVVSCAEVGGNPRKFVVTIHLPSDPRRCPYDDVADTGNIGTEPREREKSNATTQ